MCKTAILIKVVAANMYATRGGTGGVGLAVKLHEEAAVLTAKFAAMVWFAVVERTARGSHPARNVNLLFMFARKRVCCACNQHHHHYANWNHPCSTI